MCTPTIASTLVTTAAIDVAKGKSVGTTAKQTLDPRPLFEQPKPETPTPPPDLRGEQRRARARELRRTLAGRPGAGRRATIVSNRTGAGNPNLKTKTGQ